MKLNPILRLPQQLQSQNQAAKMLAPDQYTHQAQSEVAGEGTHYEGNHRLGGSHGIVQQGLV